MPLDSDKLSSRLRDLLRNHPAPGGARDEVRPLGAGERPPENAHEPRYVLDDEVAVSGDAPTGCVVIERHYDLELRHGVRTVAQYAHVVERCLPALAVLAAGHSVPVRGPLLFFDLETTGLSGGAGTLAFLVGCGHFDEAGFHTVQYFLAGYEAEHELLETLTALTGKFAGLVTFNGRTFDVPLIETRYLFHRLPSPFGALPHFDMLHPARRLWRRREDEGGSCALGALEEAVLGVGRIDDVPGSEIPSRYFHYLRTGDVEPLQAVFEHNRLDLISLAALTALGMRIVDDGPAGIQMSHEALAMGQLYAGLGRAEEAEVCFARAIDLDAGVRAPKSAAGAIRAEALRRLALQRRRQRRFNEAADAWRRMLDAGTPDRLVQEARQALAIHHEHHARDFEAAHQFAARALEVERDPGKIDSLRHRLQRLNRKIGRGPVRT